jgi:hypothetical protein
LIDSFDSFIHSSFINLVVWNIENWVCYCSYAQQKFMVLDHFTEKSFHRKFLTERPFDRKFILPNCRLSERCLTESLFYRKVIWPIFISENGHLTESTFDKKCHLTEKKLGISSFISFIWPKAFSENNHLTERSSDRKFVWPKAIFEKWSFDQIFYFKWSFSKNWHLTDEDIWTIKLYSGRMQFQKWEKLFRF